jgi:hypothetical protein
MSVAPEGKGIKEKDNNKHFRREKAGDDTVQLRHS